MEADPPTLKLLFLWTCLALGLLSPAGASGAGQVARGNSGEQLHRTKRTMTTICVEIRPSSPQDEPYYMCRGASFGAEGGQQRCVAVKNQGGQEEPFFMCRGSESAGPAGQDLPPSEPSPPMNPHPAAQPESAYNFQFLPALGGGAYPQQPLPNVQPASPPPYQEKPPSQPPPAQHQPAIPYGFYGHHVAAPSPAPAAQSPGLPGLYHPAVGSPPAAPPGAPAGPSPAAPPAPHDPAATPRSSVRSNGFGVVGSSRHRVGFGEDVLGAPGLGFKRDELSHQYRRPLSEPYQQDQLMWVPLSHTEDPENDPVMRAFYGSLAGARAPAEEVPQPVGNKREHSDAMVGQMATAYSPHNGQYPEPGPPPTLPPPPPTYSQPEPNPYCSGCGVPSPPLQCPAPPDNGVSYSTACPSFQPVIITMPCYGQRPPAPFFQLPRAPPAMVGAQPMGPAFGLNSAPLAAPFGGGFGVGSQLRSPFGVTPQGYDMEHQVGGPFGMGMQLGMGLNPFGPFGALNPFNPFNRMLGAPAPTAPEPNGNFFQRVFKFDQSDASSTTTEAAHSSEAHSERSGRLNFSSSTPSPASRERDRDQADAIVGDAEQGTEDEDSDEAIDTEEDQAVTTPEADVSGGDPKVEDLVSKAAELLKNDKRKRHNPRSSGRVPQKHRYLQQL